MEFNIQAVENIISSSPRKNGCFNLFFKLNDKIGIKLSNNPEQRDTNYSNQEIAAGYGLGPEVYGKIDEVQYEGNTYWGYFTEIVWAIENFRDYKGVPKALLYITFQEDINDLKDQLSECCNYDFDDDHLGNIGVKDGKLVCIDFDEESTQVDIKLECNY